MGQGGITILHIVDESDGVLHLATYEQHAGHTSAEKGLSIPMSDTIRYILANYIESVIAKLEEDYDLWEDRIIGFKEVTSLLMKHLDPDKPHLRAIVKMIKEANG